MGRKSLYVINMARLPMLVECEACPPKEQANTCWDCGGPFSEIAGHPLPVPLRSHTADHSHGVAVGDMSGAAPAFRMLCIECYRKDFAVAYPNSPLPV